MISRQAEVRALIRKIQKSIGIPNHLEYEAALNAEDERALGIFNMPHADELFSEGVLSLDHLSQAKTLAELTALLDNYNNIIDFYDKNHAHFYRLISSPVFKSLLDKKGDLNCWNELMQHSYKKLRSNQSTTLIMDTLMRIPSPLELHMEEENRRSLRF